MRMNSVVFGAMLLMAMIWGLQPVSRAQSNAAAPQASGASGNVVFQHWCVHCHGAGPGHPGTTALQAKYKDSLPALLEERTDLTTGTVKFYVRHGVSIMPVFRKTEIGDADLDDLAVYLSRGRN